MQMSQYKELDGAKKNTTRHSNTFHLTMLHIQLFLVSRQYYKCMCHMSAKIFKAFVFWSEFQPKLTSVQLKIVDCFRLRQGYCGNFYDYFAQIELRQNYNLAQLPDLQT